MVPPYDLTLTSACAPPVCPADFSSGRSGTGYVLDVDGTLILGIAGPAVGGGLVLVKSWIDSRLGNRQKTEERSAARDEGHREQLRQAYAEFISSYLRFIDTGKHLYSLHLVIRDRPG